MNIDLTAFQRPRTWEDRSIDDIFFDRWGEKWLHRFTSPYHQAVIDRVSESQALLSSEEYWIRHYQEVPVDSVPFPDPEEFRRGLESLYGPLDTERSGG